MVVGSRSLSDFVRIVLMLTYMQGTGRMFILQFLELRSRTTQKQDRRLDARASHAGQRADCEPDSTSLKPPY
jgi:hypothetical protein